MVLSTRVIIQWLPDEAEELTSTMVFSTPGEIFTDVRVFKSHYPYLKKPGEPEPLEEVFQFVTIGWEEEIKNTNQMRFHTVVNLQEILKAIKTKKPLDECRAAPDIGAFWPVEGSDDRKETGAMENPATGKVTEYVEIWRSLNPEEATPTKEVREGQWPSGERDVRVRVYDTITKGYTGRIVRLGNWVQGVLFDASETQHPLSVFRAFYDEKSEKWTTLIDYGYGVFPSMFKDWDATQAEENGVEWKRVE